MEKTKMTQKDYFKEIIELATANGRNDIVEFCNGRIKLLEKKSTSKSLTKVQKENIGIKEDIVNILKEKNTYMSITEIVDIQLENTGVKLSNQKISALLTQLKNDNLVVRKEDKDGVKFMSITD